MRTSFRGVLLVLTAILATGCGSSEPAGEGDSSVNMNGTGVSESPTADGSSADGDVAEAPEVAGVKAATLEFLGALKAGDDTKANQMLTALAQKNLGKKMTPPASDTARFEIEKVEMIGSLGARVTTRWIDIAHNGKPNVTQYLWVFRSESSQWRVAGVGAEVFAGEPPLLLNFEDPQDMERQLNWLAAEVARRRAASAPSQAQRPAGSTTEIRR